MAERKDDRGSKSPRDDTITADDLKGVAAVPQDGDGEGNKSGAHAGDRQGDEVDPGAG
ncbi:hypothetical protein SAMN02799631_02626 [Methylobacterium sp. 174MFSha1.1]|uniref:hypothetical protein n=1 Tax=Methylobacterium sp. 174MFSha1.1 TaxID=1502749 RepID=UPI0008F2D1B0|nr:hypothetical protein [Methylobacterium sp. 174MFSha1.1]SFU84517.1 hypothetical protein SAMN02799631_02626 [Methylobacterium sp. 174MFSha1.1]